MENTNLTPEESLRLISKTIEETKNRFKASGHIYIFWGCLIFIVTLGQFLLIRYGYARRIGLPCLLYPLGGIYTFLYYGKKFRNLPTTIIGKILGTVGWVLGANLMILGFFFYDRIGEALSPVFIVFLAIFTIITGVAIKFRPLIVGGIIVNLIGISTFFIDWQFHPLAMTITSVVAFIIPGILLNKAQRNEQV